MPYYTRTPGPRPLVEAEVTSVYDWVSWDGNRDLAAMLDAFNEAIET